MDIKKFENTVAACNRCGFCTSYCPTYIATGNETHSPRGRNQAFRALIEGKVTNAAQVKESIESCLLCGECTSVCFSEVPTAQLMVQARNYLNEKLGVSKGLTLFFKTVLPYPKRMAMAARVLFWGKRLGLAALAEKTGLLKALMPEAATANALLPTAPPRLLLDEPISKPHQETVLLKEAHARALKGQRDQKAGAPAHVPQARPKVAYMPACGSQYVRPSVGLATLALCNRLKVDFMIPETLCCGLPATSYGVLESAQQMARENIERLEKGHFESIILDDSSCTTQIKEFPKILQDDPTWLKRAHDLAQKVRDWPSYLLLKGLKEHLKLASWSGGPVAYHDPCKAQYGQKIVNPPRELLKSVPGLELMTVTDADQCCGGAGTYSVARPEMSQAVLAAKIKNIVASKCKIVVTSSVSCLIQLEFGLRKEKSKVEALHLSEFLQRALEKRK